MSKSNTLERDVVAPHHELAGLIELFARNDGFHTTQIAPLSLIRYEHPTQPRHDVYCPAICLVAQGSKRVMAGSESYDYDPSRFFLITVDLPVVGQVTAATPQAPYLGLHLAIDPQEIGALLAHENLPAAPADSVPARGISVGKVSAPLVDAATRLVRLLNEPQHAPVLAPLITREIYYLLLVSEQGEKLRRIAYGHGEMQGIMRALEWLKVNYAEPLYIEQIAREVHMSVSGFHHQFKAVTAMSPLQYQKQLRLQAARRLMLSAETDAATAALRVGYESSSQFSREYRRTFGAPPRRDIARLRSEIA